MITPNFYCVFGGEPIESQDGESLDGVGETRLTTGTMQTDQLFTGQREITELGIYHYGARFYSPKLGRFLSADTIVPNAANPQDFNRYSYVRNNPVRYMDPSGNIPIDCYNDPSYCSNTTTLPSSPYSPTMPNPSGGSTPSVIRNAPAISVPTPSVTPTPAFVSSTATPAASSTPSISTATPTICPTPMLGTAPCSTDYPNNPNFITIAWSSEYVQWDEVWLDVAGLFGDVFPVAQLPTTAAEAMQVYGHSLNVGELILDGFDIHENSDDLSQVDWGNVGLDTLSLVPGWGAVPSTVGILYNLSQGFYFREQPYP